MAQATVKDTTGYVNYVYNISARGTTEVASQLLGLSGMATNILGQLAFQTNSYISTTEGALLSMGVIATAGFTKATQQAMEFDQALSTIGAISGQTRGEVTKLGDDAMAMSNKFGVAVSEMTEGMESLARAGVSQGNMTAILEEAMGLSKLEGLTLDTAINDLISTTNLLDTQGLDSSSTEYADAVRYQNQKITATSEAAPIGAQDIIHTLEHIGGYASSTNLDQDDLYAVIAQLGSKGTKSEMAGTSLRAFIAAGQKDTAQRALNRIGLNVKDLWKNDDTIMSITDMKDVLDEAMESRGYTQQEKLEFYSDFAGYKQANQIMKIDTQSAREFKEKIDHSWNMGQKIAQVIGTAETHVQGLMQAGTNLLTKVGEPFLPIISTIAVTLKTGIDIINAIPGSNLVIAGGLILVSVKAISTIFNKIAPQILAAKGNIGSMREFFDSIVKSLKESYTLIKNINNTDWIKRQAHINEVNHITNDDKMRYWQHQTGKRLYGMTDVYRLEKKHGFKNNQKYIDWKMRENYKTKKSRNERNETQNEPTGTTESSNNRKDNKKSDCCDSIIQVMKEGFVNQISNANTIKDRVVDIYGFLSNSAIDKSIIDDLKTNIFSVYVTNMGDGGSSGGGSQDSKSVGSSKSNTRTSSSSPKSGTKLFTKGRLDQAKVDKFIDDFYVDFGFDQSTNEGRKTQEMLNNYAKDILRDNFKYHRNKLTGQKREVLQKIIDNETKAEDQPYHRGVATLGGEKFDSILASHSGAKVYSSEDLQEMHDAFRSSIRYKSKNETADDSLADLGFDYSKARDNLRDSGKFFVALANLGDVNLDDVDMDDSTYRSKIRDKIASTLKSNDKEKIKKLDDANKKITEALRTNIGYHYVNDLNTTAREDFMKSVKLESTGNPYIDMVNYFDERNQGKITDTKIEDDLDKIKILGNIVYADKDKMNINSEYPYRRDLGKGPNIKTQVDAGIEKALKMQGTNGYGGIASHIKKITDSYVEMAVRDDILEMQKEMEKETGKKVSISDVIKATPSLVYPNRFKINHRVYDDIGKESPDLLNKEDTIYNGLRALHNKNIGGNEEYRNRTFGENDFGQLEHFKLVFADEKPGVYYEKEREELSNLSFQSLLALIQPPEITKAAEDIGPKTIGGDNTGTKNVGVAEVRNLPYLFEGTPIQNMGMRLPTHGAKMDNTAVMGTAYIPPESALGDFNSKIIKDDTGEPVAQEVEVLKGFIRNDRGRYHEATNWALTQSRNREEMRKRQEVAFGSIAQKYGISRQDIMQMPLTQSQKERIEELYGQQDFVDIKQYIEENGEDAFKQLRGKMSLHKFDYDYDTGKLVDNGEMFTIKVTPQEYKKRLKANLIYKDEGDYGILSVNKNKKTGEETYTIHDFDALHYSYNDIKRRVLLEDVVRAKELESHNDFMTKNVDYISEYLGADYLGATGPYTVIPDLVKATNKDLQDYNFNISENLSPDDIAEKLLDAPINQIDTLLHTIYSYNKKIYNKVIDSLKTKRIEEQSNIKGIELRKEDVRSELERFDNALNVVDNIFPNLKNILSNKEKTEYMKLLSESDRPMDELMVIAQRHGVNVGGINSDSPENLSTSLYNDDDYNNDIEYDFIDAMNQSELPDVTFFDVATVSDEITGEFLEALNDTLVYDTRGLVSSVGQDAGENRIEKINKILNTDINKDRLKDYQAVNDYFNVANAMAFTFGDKKVEPIQDSFLSEIDVSSFNNIGTNLNNKTQVGGYEKELIQDSFLSGIDVSSFNNIGTNLNNKTQVGGYEKEPTIMDTNEFDASAYIYDNFVKNFNIDDYNQTTPKKTPISFDKNIKGEIYVKTLKDILHDFKAGIASDKNFDLNNAAKMYTNAKEYDIGSSDLGLFLGRALLLTGKEDDALSELLDSQEKSPRAGILASLIQLQQNNVEEAIKTLNLVKQQHAGNEKIINEANSILSQILPQDNAKKTVIDLSNDEDYKKAVGVGPSQNIPQPRPDPEHYDEWLKGKDNAKKTVIDLGDEYREKFAGNKKEGPTFYGTETGEIYTEPPWERNNAKKTVIEPIQDSFLSGIDASLFNNIGTNLKNKTQIGGYEQGREVVDNIKQRLDNFISPKVDKMYKRFGNHDNSKVSDKLDDWSGKLTDATDTLQGFSVYLQEASELFPPLSIAVLGLEGIITTVTKINKGTQALNSFLNIGNRLKDGDEIKFLNKVFSSNNNAGKMLMSATGMVGEAFETLTTIFWEFLGPIALITAGLIAIKGALDWSYQSHQKYLKSLEEDQKEHRSKAKGLQTTNENAQELARNNRAPRQQAALDRNAQLAQTRLDNANMTRSHGAIEITRQKNDTLWGDYGISAGLSKLQGNYESTASEYDGTTGQVRRIKEATLANPFSSDAMNQVSSYYDANQLAFGVMDEYKDELGKLYDSETSAMLKYHSDDVRGSPEFNKALDDFVQATGITRDHAKQYLDYMQTEHEVDKATQAMQAQADQISANTELKVQAIAFGGNPADVLGLNGIEAQQGAMIKAQADMIKMELSGQLWWKAVWATITTPIKLILSPIFIIVDLLNAIWSLMTGNIGGAFESGGRAASRLNVFGEAATYWGAWAETEGTDFSAIGQSATDSYNRTNYGNVEQSALGGYHPTHYLDANASQDRKESVGGGYSGGQSPRGGYVDHRESQTHYTNANRGSYHFMNSGGGPGESGGIQFNPLGTITGLLSSILGVLVNGLLIGGGIYGIYKLIKSDFNFKDLGAGILNTIKDKGSSLLYDIFKVDDISGKATDILGKFFNLDGIKKRVSGISGPATEDEKGNLTRYGQLVKAKEDFLANNAWGNYLGEKLMPDDFNKEKRKGMNKKDRDYLSKRYGIDISGARTDIQADEMLRTELDKQGKWDEAVRDLHNNRYIGSSLKNRVTDTVSSYADPWREYLGNQYETRKQNLKDNINGYVGGLQEEAERYRAGDIREEDLSDGARLYARGLDIKDQIFGKASQTDFSALINNPAEFLSDPRNIEKMGKDIYSNYKDKYQKAKEDPAAQEEYDWYKEGGAMRFMDLSRENKIRAIGDKLSGIKTGMFGMEEGESVREMLKNPERTIEVLQNARKSIQENGWMESLGLDEDFGVSDAVKDKVSGFFDKIKEGAEEGIDDDDKKGGNGGLIERAKKKLAGLFGFGKEEETPESEPTTADKDPNSLKNIIKNKDKDPKAYAKYLEMNKADHDVGAPLLGNEERYSVLGGEKPDELANMSYKERIQYMKDQAEIAKVRMGDPFIKEETPGAVAEEPSIMDIADTYSLSDIADNFGMNKGGSIGDIIDKVGGGKKNPLSKIGQKGKGALGKLGGKKGIGGLAKGGVGKLAKGGIGKAVSGIGGKAVSKIGSKLASKGIAQIGSKVLGGALIASGIGAPLGLLLESPIGGMLIEGAMDLGGKALGAIGGAASGLLGGIGGLLGFGKKTHYQQAGGRGMNPLGMMMPGIGLAGAIAGGIGSLFGGNTHNMGAAGNVGLMKMINPLTMGVGLLDSIFRNNKDHKNQSTSIGDLAKNILKNLIDGNKEKSNNNSSGGNITIQNININTADDPEAIKAMFLELLIELQEQVNPRIVSRTVGQSPNNSSTTTDASLTDTSTTDTSTTNENQNNNGTNT